LRDLELGDKKPSYLLREMQQLAGDQLADDMLKNLWLQHLPVQVQTILTTCSDSLSNLSKMADKIHEVSEVSTVATVNTEKQYKCQTNNSHSDLELQIISLKKAIEELSQRGRNKDRRDDKQYRRTRSKSHDQKEREDGLCYFHSKFKAQARICKGSWCKIYLSLHNTKN